MTDTTDTPSHQISTKTCDTTAQIAICIRLPPPPTSNLGPEQPHTATTHIERTPRLASPCSCLRLHPSQSISGRKFLHRQNTRQGFASRSSYFSAELTQRTPMHNTTALPMYGRKEPQQLHRALCPLVVLLLLVSRDVGRSPPTPLLSLQRIG